MVKHEHKWNDSLTVIEVTDKGMRRATNQDSSVVVLQSDEESYQQRGHLFVVCDGMGAHAAGELASGDAVDHIPHHYLVYQNLSPLEALEKRRSLKPTLKSIARVKRTRISTIWGPPAAPSS